MGRSEPSPPPDRFGTALAWAIDPSADPDPTFLSEPQVGGHPWLVTDQRVPLASRPRHGRAFVGGFLACYLVAAALIGTVVAYGRPDIRTGGVLTIGATWPLALGLFAYRARERRHDGTALQSGVPDEGEGSPFAPAAHNRLSSR